MSFPGFSKDTIRFFKMLKDNNAKAWFEQNRNLYDNHVLPEAQKFVVAMGAQLSKISDEINADPRIDKSIFRLYRDVRFSKDKQPYKTHLALLFWEGSFKKLETPSFYFHLEPDNLMLASGMYIFPKDLIQVYRDAVVDDIQGRSLEKAIQQVQKKGNYQLGWEKYKTVPRGYDAGHARSHLLKMGGIGFSIEMPVPAEIFSPDAVEFAYRHFENMSPVYLWLKQMMQGAR